MDLNETPVEKAWGEIHKDFTYVLNKSRKQYSTKQLLYGHFPPISQTSKTSKTCWRSKHELISDIAQLAGVPEFTDCISAEGLDLSATSVLFMTLNTNGFGEYEIPLHCHRSHVHSGPGSYLWFKSNCLIFKASANKWLMPNWIVRNRIVWSFYCVSIKCLQIMYIFNKYE